MIDKILKRVGTILCFTLAGILSFHDAYASAIVAIIGVYIVEKEING